MKRLFVRLRAIVTRTRHEREMAEEFESHLAMHMDDNLRRGMTPADARRQALLKFGGIEATKEAYRETRAALLVEQWCQDLRYGARTLGRAPVFTCAAIGTLAIGIGASVAVFSVVDPLLFRSLPYPNDSQLVSFGYFGPVDSNEFTVVSSYLDWRKQQGPFQSVTSMRPAEQCDLASGNNAKQVRCAAIEATFLQTFGIPVALGRDFTSEDDQASAPQVALISDRLWRGSFNGDAQIVNREIFVDSNAFRIIGVLPAGFELPQLGDVDVMRTARLNGSLRREANASAPLRSFGRLKKGISIEQGRLQMEPLMRETAVLDVPKPLLPEVRYVFRSLRERRIHEVRTASWMLLGAILGLLLVSCANVANLLLARGESRSREMALRSAVGAGRWRLVRQTLTESLLLGVAGCAAGCALGWAVLKVFIAIAPEGLLRLDHATVDARVLAFALIASGLSSLIFGTIPALQRPARDAILSWSAGTPARTRFRKVLVAAQVAVSLILLTGASLFVKSFVKLENQALGFEPERLVTASFTLRQRRYASPAAQAAFAMEVEQRLSRVAGTAPFALSDSIPPGSGGGRPYSNMRIEGRPPLSANGGMVMFRNVTPGYFRVMQIPVLFGRSFVDDDRTVSEEPLILSATLAQKMFAGESPLGQRISLSDDGRLSVVIGVVADVRNNGLTQPLSPEYYRLRMSDGRQVGRSTVALFRTSLPPDTLAPFVLREMNALDPSLPVEIQTMESRVRGLQERPRFLMLLVASFAVFGLLLSSAGLYGVLSFLVAQRTREIGIRLAVGAPGTHVALLFFKQALGCTATGAAVGVAGSYVLAGTVKSLLFEVSPYDPASLSLAAAVLVLAALSATYLPVRRATRIDPVIALRAE